MGSVCTCVCMGGQESDDNDMKEQIFNRKMINSINIPKEPVYVFLEIRRKLKELKVESDCL